MKQSFTPLIARATNARFGKVYLTGWLLLLFLMMGNMAWGQTNVSTNYRCAQVGQPSTTIEVTGNGFDIGTGNQVQVRLNGTQLTSGVSRVSTSLIRITIPASYFAQSGQIVVEAGNRIQGRYNWQDAGVIIVLAAPTVSTPAPICQNQSAALVASGAPANGGYRWYTVASGGSPVGTEATYTTPSLTTSTTYYVSTVAAGCESARTAVTATVNSIPTAPTNATANAAAHCGSGTSTLSATSGANGNTIRWYSAPTGGTLLATTNGSYTTENLTTTTTFYAASFNTTTGCESATRTAVTVTISPVPSAPANVTASPTEVCGSGTVTLSATPGTNATSIRWYAAPSGGNPLETGPSVGMTVDASTTFYAASYNPTTTCESNIRVPVRVTVNPVPGEPAVTGDAVCDGGEVTLNATVGSNANQVRWYTATSGGAPFTTGNTYTTTVSQTTTYYVSSYNTVTECESARVPVTATVIETPVATVIPEGPLAICSGSTTVLAAGAAPPGAVYTYQWSDENGALATETAQTLTVSEAGTYSVVITSGGLCVSEPSNEVTVTTIPLPDAPNAEAGSRCGPGSVTLTASGAPEGGTYRWYTTAAGGSPVGTEATFVTPELELSRLYYVAVVNESGCESPRTEVEVIINLLPEAGIASETPRCQDPSGVTSFLLNGSAVNGAFLEWAIVGGTASAVIVENTENDFTPVVNVTGAGTVQVQLTVQGNNNCGSATDVIELEIYPTPPAVTVNVAPVERCGPGEVTLTIINPDAAYTYNWYNAASELVFTGTGFTNDIDQTTSYFIAVTGTGNCENPQRTEVSAIVNPTPEAPTNVSASVASLCGGGPVTLSATPGANGTTVRWYEAPTGGTLIATGLSYAPAVNATTTFYATSYNETTGCESATRTPVTVTVNPVPGAPTVSAPAPLCGSGTVNLVAALGANASTARWYNAATGGTFLATGINYSPNVTASTTFYVTSYNANTTCESARVPVEVVVNPVPAVPTNVVANPTALCGSGQVTLSATTGANGNTVRWYSAATGGILLETGTSVNRTVNTNTTFFAASFNATTGCESTTRVSVSVTVGSAIANNTLTQPTQPICAGVVAPTINGLAATGGNGALVYTWERSTTSATAGFTAIPNSNVRNYSPGALNQTTWFRRVASTTGSGCISTSNVVQVTVTPITTLTLVLQANPFPVCPGQQTSYTATVIANVTAVNYPANPRYEEITWEGGEDVSHLFTFDWWKNDNVDNQEGQTGRTVSQAGLSSTDYFTVRARPNSSFNLSCVTYANRPEFTPVDNKGNVLFSNRVYLGTPGVAVSMANPGPVCAGTSVTFTATPSAFAGAITYQWTVNGNPADGATSNTFTSSTLNDGDVVAVNYNATQGNCGVQVSGNSITMVVHEPVAIEDQRQNQEVCQGTDVSFNASTTTGTYLNYQWFKDGIAINGATGASLAIADAQVANAGDYSVRVSNVCSPDGVLVHIGSLAVNNLQSFTGELEVRNDAGLITADNPILPGEPLTFTAVHDLLSSGQVQEYRWFTRSMGTDDWGSPTVITSSNQFTIGEVEPGEFEVRVEVAPANDGSFCYATLIMFTEDPLVPLPVEIIYFNAARQGHNVLLEWATASEENNTGFEVQVSQDGFNFRKLGFVPSKNGNTAIKQVYTYKDTEKGKYGTRYYRLKQLDDDGRFEYFTTRGVSFGEAGSYTLKAFPNPFSANITLDIAAENTGQVQVTLWNAVGRQLLERTVEVEEGFNTVDLNISGDLPHGVYFLRVYLDGRMHQLKMLKE